ncbi:MAG TPA: universal stress protein [Bacteroidales bacterium]|nr:universal stress protein [Bacteroidales bacterium]
MKNIIVPVDFSTESLNGLKMAALFSTRQQISIHLIYVLQRNSETEKDASVVEKNTAEKKFETIINEFKPQLQNDSVIDYKLAPGRIYQEVVNLAKQWPNSVISTSTHGASGFQEVFIGSNAFRIISATESPVITLRKNYCPSSIRKIVLPIDLSADSRQKVPFTTELARLFNAEVHVVAVQTSKGKQNIKKIRSYASQVAGYIQGKVTCENNEVFGDNVPDMIINYANTVRADLISITTEQSSAISLIMGNTAHQILNKAEIPVLCLAPRHITKSGSFASMGG